MGVKVAATCFHLSQPLLPHPPPSSHCYSYQSLASTSASSSSSSLSSPPVSPAGSRRRRRRSLGGLEGPFACSFLQITERTSFLGGQSGRLLRSRSCDMLTRLDSEQGTTLRRVVSATLNGSFFSAGDDEEGEDFARRLQDSTLRCEESATARAEAFFSENSRAADNLGTGACEDFSPSRIGGGTSTSQLRPVSLSAAGSATPPPWLGIRPEPPEWVEEGRKEIILAAAGVERNAATVDLPLSLRILKRKKRWESESWISEAGETAACSVKKALSSLVFIIRELQSYALQLRSGSLFSDDSLQEVLIRVHREVHASFCWLFGHIFASTPTLMVSVMLLLANFTVYSMGHSLAVAAPSMVPPPLQTQTVAMSTLLESSDDTRQAAAPPVEFTSASSHLSLRSQMGVNGGGGGGIKAGPVAGASDDGLSSLYQRRTVLPDSLSSPSKLGVKQINRGTPVVPEEEESRVWAGMVEEATRMRAAEWGDALKDNETTQHFVAPVVVEAEPDEDYQDYLRTELMYQQALIQDPTNAMLLSNFAQFLYLVSRDHDRAEYYFKRAAELQPPDAEALGRYATFLWMAKKDLGGAEETYLEAIAADPGNTVHAANYAHFLWNTGGEDTCFPLSDLDEETEEDWT